jgi:hypothetical protein
MYLYSADNAVVYTSEDLLLFRESPFACWMERLTLENPEHGIAPDKGSAPPRERGERQDDMAETLRAEGKDVVLIDWDRAEPGRRTATLDAMRRGVDFIVNGQLAVGPLADSANLLMRTSGYSELGDYLYIPCDTQLKTALDSAFSLCFLADLLHGLQGQLPPQMLVFRGGSDLMPLQTEDHIYYYRAVKQRFMEAMRGFRKHRMPDPAESAHFGRWWACAQDVLKQRALRGEQAPDIDLVEEEEEDVPLVAVRQAVGSRAPAYDMDEVPAGHRPRRTLSPGAPPGAAVLSPGGQAPAGLTLVEQARMMAAPSPATTARPTETGPSQTESLAPRAVQTAASRSEPRRNDAAFANLEFIGSRSHRRPLIGRDFPAPPLPEEKLPETGPHPVDGAAYSEPAEYPAVDSDSASCVPPSLGPISRSTVRPERDDAHPAPARPRRLSGEDSDRPEPPPFSDSLITSDDFED